MNELNPQRPEEAYAFRMPSRAENLANFDPYANSSLVDKIRVTTTPKLVCLDLDGTMDQDPAAASRVVDAYQAQGAVIIHVTSRTEEMCMSREDYERSLQYGFTRPIPKMYRDPEMGKLVERFGDEVGAYDKYAGQYSPDVIVAQTGGRVYVRQRDGGYALDKEHEHSLGVDIPSWRTDIMAILHEINPDGTLFNLSGPEDDRAKYQSGRRDVDALELRHTVRFDETKEELDGTGATSAMGDLSVAEFNYQRMVQFIEEFHDYQETLGVVGYRNDLARLKLEFKKAMVSADGLRRSATSKELENQYRNFVSSQVASFDSACRYSRNRHGVSSDKLAFARNIRLTSDSNPDKGRFQVYITPRRATKQRGLHNVVQRISEATGVQIGKLQMVYAGDSYPDLKAGSYAGADASVTHVWVADSRMTKVLTDKDTVAFGNVTLRATKKRLSGREQGEWEFKPPLFKTRKVIIGAVAAPNTKGPQTLEALQEQGHI